MGIKQHINELPEGEIEHKEGDGWPERPDHGGGEHEEGGDGDENKDHSIYPESDVKMM